MTSTPFLALPRHVGIIMDGNRRWARTQGRTDAGFGHSAGAAHLSDVLEWLASRSIGHCSVYLLSADNIRKRDRLEIDGLFWLIEHEIPKRVRAAQDWQLHVSGDTSLLPDSARNALEAAISDTHGRPSHLTVAIGYDAHEDILGAVRRALVDPRNHELSRLSVGSVSEQLAGGPVKEIDLVIRTGGDHRISGFFPWQSKAAELFVTRRTWPDFAEDDLDDALAFYARKATGAQTSRSTAT